MICKKNDCYVKCFTSSMIDKFNDLQGKWFEKLNDLQVTWFAKLHDLQVT